MKKLKICVGFCDFCEKGGAKDAFCPKNAAPDRFSGSVGGADAAL